MGHRKNTPHAINDPVRDARLRRNTPFLPFAYRGLDDETVIRHTTGEFNRQDHPYHSHCTPTAITNLILTLDQINTQKDPRMVTPELADMTPADIFETVAGLGKKSLLYYNMHLWGLFGGTAICFNGLFLRLCLHHFRMKPRKITPHLILYKERLVNALSKQHPALISVIGHPVYGSHTMLAYGLDILQNEEGHPEYYLRLADGWASRPRYINLKDLHIAAFWEITP